VRFALDFLEQRAEATGRDRNDNETETGEKDAADAFSTDVTEIKAPSATGDNCVTSDVTAIKATADIYADERELEWTTVEETPSVEDFSTCYEYLEAVLVEKRQQQNGDEALERRYVSTEVWEYILEEMIGTLPAGKSPDLSALISADMEPPTEYAEKKVFDENMHRKSLTPLNNFSVTSFAFRACQAFSNHRAAITLFRKLSVEGQVEPVHKKEFLRVFHASQNVLVSDRLNLTEKEAEYVCSICDEVVASGEDSCYGEVIAVWATQASKWEDAYQLWNQTKDVTLNKTSIASDTYYALSPAIAVQLAACALFHARAAIEAQPGGSGGLNREAEQLLDKFWQIIRHPTFTVDYNYLRTRKYQHTYYKEKVYVRYIEFCVESYLNSKEHQHSYFGMEPLFQAFRDTLYCGNGEVEDAIIDFFNHKVPEKLGYSPFNAVFEKYMKRTGFCPRCNQKSWLRKISNDESAELHDAFLRIVLSRPESTSLQEILGFQRQLEGLDYDCVVDGLNMTYLNNPFGNKKRGNMALSTKRHEVLLSGIKRLVSHGLKPLLIHRPHIKKFPNYLEIKDLAPVIVLDNLTEDDPYFIMAALWPYFGAVGPGSDNQNKRMFVTNDVLHDHYARLPNGRLKRIMSRWMFYHQIKTMAIFNQQSKQTPDYFYLTFPQNEDITTSKLAIGWHVPLDFNERRPVDPDADTRFNGQGFIKMRPAESFICITPSDILEKKKEAALNRFAELSLDS